MRRPPVQPPQRLDPPARHDDEEDGPPRLWSGLPRERQVILAALALIAVSLIWKGVFLSHFYFRQDDFQVLDASLKSGLTWKLLTFYHTGHLYPGVYLISWILAHTALYSWGAGAGVELVLIAGSSLAAWRLLRTLLGSRPALLIPLALYVLTPLTFQAYSWWIAGVEAIPLQIAIFMALDAHVRYVRTGRFRHAVATALWLAFGLFFFEKSVMIPVLLFAVTAGFLLRKRSLLLAIGTTATRFWRAWALQAAVLAVYAVIFVTSLSGSKQQPGTSSVHTAVTFGWRLLLHSFLPGILGGPWRWDIPLGSAGGETETPAVLSWAALLIVLAVILASMLTRKRAWRGWAILLGWLILDDVLPLVAGRLSAWSGYAAGFADQTRYVDDAMAVLAVVIALIFWPLADQAEEQAGRSGRREFFTSVWWRRTAAAVLAVSVLGSLWSVSQLITKSTVASRPYIASASADLRKIPAGTVILNGQVPDSVMEGTFGQDADVSAVLGPLAPKDSHLAWTQQPAGNIGGLRMFGPDGRLGNAGISGATAQPASAFADCLTARRRTLSVAMPASTAGLRTTVLRIDYLADSAAAGERIQVSYNGSTSTIPVTGKANNFYMTVTGTAPSVTLQATAPTGSFCLEKAVAGYFVALTPASQ